MAQFTKGRFQARLYAFCWTILETRQPDFNAEKIKQQTWLITILQSMDYATAQEKDVIQKLPNIIKTQPEIEDQQAYVMGALEGKQVVYQHLDPNLLLEKTEIGSTTEQESSTFKNPKISTKKHVLLGCIIAVIVGSIIYNLPICKEYRDYKKVINTTSVYESIEACDTYLDQYGIKGRHSGDVMYLKVTRTIYDVRVMADYLITYPQHEHFNEVKAKYDAVWDKEIAKYESSDKSKEDKDAVAYMTTMLTYMRNHFCNDIMVSVDMQTNLKEYSEYDENIRLYLELFNSNTMKIEDGMVSLKDNFSTRNRAELKKILIDGLQKSFNRIFTPYFINVVTDNSNIIATTPCTQFICQINSQEDKIEDYIIPHYWIYKDGTTKKVLGYLMGISIHFDANFSIPQSDVTYTYSEQGHPENDITNIQDIKDGYLHMSAMCFAQFANKMAKNLGLQEIYFQGE